MADTKISALPAAGALDGTELLPLVQGGATEQVTLNTMKAFMSPESFIYQNADFALANVATAQKMFGQTTNGRVTLPVGLYELDMMVYLTGMSATSGNANFDLKGAGTAVIGGALLQAVGIDNNSPLAAGARSGSGVAGTGVINLASAGTGTGVLSAVSGVFKVTTAGTLVPSLVLAVASAAVVKAGSNLTIYKIAPAGVFASGDFD
jgi:hypothetical protein